jgi:TrmH family RNA methyltransferase
MKHIASAANPQYKAWLKLARDPRAVRAQRITLAEGAHLADAALAAGVPIDTVLVRAGGAGAQRDAVLSRLAHLPAVQLAAPLFDALGLVEHGIGLALVLPVPAESAGPLDGALSGDALYLDGVQEPGNAGALLRVAAAAGLRHVLASPATTALWAPKVMRGAQGAHFVLDLREGIAADQLAGAGLHLIATTPVGGTSLWRAELPHGPVGWVVGSEGQGVTPAALAACAQRVAIPLATGVESLNVATAAAVCLFERRRRLAVD